MDKAEIIEGVFVVVGVILSLTVHEWAHALVADRRGDRTPRELGRLTLNPIKHIHPVLTVLLPAFLWFVLPAITGGPRLIFGGAKPVPVVPENLRHRHRDMALVAAAGPLSNLVIAFALLAAEQVIEVQFGSANLRLMRSIMLNVAMFNVLLLLFNLLPIPPLDGSRIVAYLLPGPVRRPYQALDRIGLLLVIAFVFLIPGTQNWLSDQLVTAYDALRAAALWSVDLVGIRKS